MRTLVMLLAAVAACVVISPAAVAKDKGKGKVAYLNSGKLPPNLPFSEAVRAGHTLYLSGQIGIKPGSTTLVDGGISAQARQAMDNIKATLEGNGYAMDDLVKCTAMLADIAEWGAFNDVYKTYFKPGHFPARSAFGASGLALGARVEIECVALK
jgi:2-iminobutanoate/2-iminopropanoate deaminase